MRILQIGLLILAVSVLLLEAYHTAGDNGHDCTGIHDMPHWNPEQIGETIQNLSQAIEANPDGPQAYLDRGNAYAKLHEWDKAMADYDKALELDPNNPFARSNRGYVFTQREEWGLAIDEFSKSLEIERLADTYVKRATAFGRSGMRQAALNDLMQAMRMDTSDHLVYYASGLYHQWDRNYEAAVRYYDRCIKEFSEEIQAYWFRAECLAEQGLYEEAIRSYRDYIERENPLATEWVEAARQKIKELEQTPGS